MNKIKNFNNGNVNFEKILLVNQMIWTVGTIFYHNFLVIFKILHVGNKNIQLFHVTRNNHNVGGIYYLTYHVK